MRAARLSCLSVMLLAAALLSGASPPGGSSTGGETGGRGIPGPPYKDLKVLPKDIGKKELMSVMKAQTRALGVKCKYCHDTKDYAAATEHKDAARDMMRMVDRIDKDLFTWKDAPRATCYMCHHGEKGPAMEPSQGAKKKGE
jgi:hypothetical protein